MAEAMATNGFNIRVAWIIPPGWLTHSMIGFIIIIPPVKVKRTKYVVTVESDVSRKKDRTNRLMDIIKRPVKKSVTPSLKNKEAEIPQV